MARSVNEALKIPPIKTSRSEKKEQARAKQKMQVCEAPGCKEEGSHPAPKSRRNPNQRFHFCLAHVREYNKSWNYFEGMTAGAVERDRAAATTWDRPTWKFGEQGQKKANKRVSAFDKKIKDGFGFFEEDADDAEERRTRETRRRLRSLTPEYREAFETLQITPPCTPDELKSHYKDLVRKLHPDLNQDDPEAESRMKAVNAAYSLVRDIIENAEQ